MKVFLSWSGHKSHEVALALRDWLPSVIQTIKPYVSSEDIDKGARWSTDIAKELEDSTYGILCVTKENVEAPWLLFEAGALSKMMDKSYVCPFIFDLKRAQVQGPILQFQSTVFEKEDVRKLVASVNAACGEEALKDDFLNKTFEVWWPNLEKKLNDIKVKNEPQEEQERPKNRQRSKNVNPDFLEEILELSRTNQRILRSPELLLPKEYLEYLLKDNKISDKRTHRRIEELRHISMELEYQIIQLKEFFEVSFEIQEPLDKESYLEFRKTFDLFQHQSHLIREIYDIIQR